MEDSKKYVCVLSTESYVDGVLILYENLKYINSSYPLLCLVNENISSKTVSLLNKYGIETKNVAKINHAGTYGYWENTFDKLNVFSLIDYSKVVCLDTDMLILENIDSLFDYDTPAMCLDKPWFTDKYNSGIMVVSPNLSDFNNLIELTNSEKGDIGDQDILNKYFSKRINTLPDNFNVMRTLSSYATSEIFHPIYKYNNPEPDNIKILHYIRYLKPFMIDALYNEVDAYLYAYYLKKARLKKQSILKELI